MTLKQSFPSFERSMVDAAKKPPIGVSQGRGYREARGAREAAIGSSERQFTGSELGEDRAKLEANVDPTQGEDRGTIRADSRRVRRPNRKPDPFEA